MCPTGLAGKSLGFCSSCSNPTSLPRCRASSAWRPQLRQKRRTTAWWNRSTSRRRRRRGGTPGRRST
eukprot:8863972-Pyramimonas_sp.AAC.1